MAGNWVILGDLMKFDDRGTKVKNTVIQCHVAVKYSNVGSGE